jgi:hypothetical protein
LELSALEASLILNLNSALGMMLGLFNGALLKVFGYRKIAVFGGILFSGGIMATAFAESFRHFLITYSIITCETASCLQLFNFEEITNLLLYLQPSEWVCALLHFRSHSTLILKTIEIKLLELERQLRDLVNLCVIKTTIELN